jgi:hypothetical protein
MVSCSFQKDATKNAVDITLINGTARKRHFTNRTFAQLQDDIYGVFAFDNDIIVEYVLCVNI